LEFFRDIFDFLFVFVAIAIPASTVHSRFIPALARGSKSFHVNRYHKIQAKYIIIYVLH